MKLNKLLVVILLCGVMMLSACGKKHSKDPNHQESHTHEFKDVYTYDETHHWQKCEGCDEVQNKLEHQFDEGRVTKEATFAEEGEITKTCSCGATKVIKTDSKAKNAINLVIPTKEELDDSLEDEEYKSFLNYYQYRTTNYMNVAIGESLYFSFDKQASSDSELVYYEFGLSTKGEMRDEPIANTISFSIYSENDLFNPILVKEHTESIIAFDEPDPLPNGKYYIIVTIDSFGSETTINDVIISASYAD